jgi:cupin 2 domain-containing protein
MNDPGSLYAIPPLAPGVEVTETLVQLGDVAIERIVSHRAASPPGFWYDQDWDEWVVLLRGEAELRMAAGSRRQLRAGDYLLIPRGVKHRVESTSAEALWLAVHVGRPRAE